MEDYYNTLQIEKNASQDQIKQAYKKLAKIHHPDKGGDKEVFQKIQTAYETLSDDQKRAAYDNPNPFQNIFGGGGTAGGAGFPFHNMGGFPFAQHNHFQDLNFMFNRNQSKKKIDHQYVLKVTLNDVFFGLKKMLNIKHDIKCNNCNKKCEVCNGTCKVRKTIDMGIMRVMQEQPCTNCNAYGIVKDNVNCDHCNNKGSIVKENKIEIVIPPGVEDGATFCFPGLGEQPKTDNEVAGDFNVIIKIDEGVLFKRDMLDLIYETNITFKESIVGKSIKIPHFETEFLVEINKFGVINPNKKYIVYGKGLKNERGNYGNLYIKFNITYDDIVLTEDQIQKLKDIL